MKLKNKFIAMILAMCIYVTLASCYNSDDEVDSTESVESNSFNTENRSNDIESFANTTEREEYSDKSYTEMSNTTLTKGEFVTKLYKECGNHDSMKYSFNNSAESFLKHHEDLFTGKADKYIDDTLIDYNLEAKYVNKNIEKYGNNLMCISLAMVLSIEEETIGNDIPKELEEVVDFNEFTYIQAVDEDGQNYIIWYLGSVDDVYEYSTIKIVGLPIGLTSFDNVSGGSTRAIVLAGVQIVSVDDAY